MQPLVGFAAVGSESGIWGSRYRSLAQRQVPADRHRTVDQEGLGTCHGSTAANSSFRRRSIPLLALLGRVEALERGILPLER